MTISPYSYLCEALIRFRVYLFGRPANARERMSAQQNACEQCANMVRTQIDRCRSIKDCHNALDSIYDFRMVWGTGSQTLAARSSLMLQLWNKQKEIIEKL